MMTGSRAAALAEYSDRVALALRGKQPSARA
jgi:hypothetical protein